MTTDQPKETEFGEILIKIIKNPSIPNNKDDLFHPSPTANRPGQPNRLQKSKLTVQAYAEAKAEWDEIISERNKFHDSHGLSYDLFMKMIRDLYGCEDIRDPEMPITREAVNHLVHTGNPWIKSKAAATLQEYNLQFICCFTQEHTFEQLKVIGDKVVDDYQKLRQQKIIDETSQQIRLSLSLKDSQGSNDDETVVYLNHKGKLTDNISEANNLITLIFNKLREKGSNYFVNSGIPLDEILAILADEKPKFSAETFTCFPILLDISLEEFLRLLTKDNDNLNVGF